MGCKTKDTHQKNQDSRSIFNIVIQFSSHTTQSKQPDYFKGTEQATDALKEQSKTTH